MRSRRLVGPVVALFTLPGAIFAQNVVSARAGLVHHLDGRVLLDEKPIVHKVAQFAEVKENSELRTERGRAEILLTPGVFLRLGEDSRIRMLSSRLADVRLQVIAGAAVVEVDELDKSSSVTILAVDTPVRLERAGLYRFDVVGDQAPRLRVLAGEALVGELRVKAQREVTLDADLVVRKFHPEDTDPLDRWSRRRANYLAVANVSASRLAWEQDGGYGYGDRRSRWMWNPYYGMYTFLPFRGVCYSPYGYGFYSPRAVYALYNPPVYSPGPDLSRPSFNSNYGYTTVPQTSGGTSGVVAASPSSPVNQGGSAPISRGTATEGGGARR